jgi:GR25 family glycosyltransferase involved in LPS biosynthesis
MTEIQIITEYYKHGQGVMRRQIGCYLSHLLLIKSLLNTQYQYTVIFEDDFYIVDDDFNNMLNNILDKIEVDFDLLFLGTTTNNHGLKYKDEIYHVDKNTYLYGTHAYVINNKNINKIYDYLLNFDLPIDVKYQELIKYDKLIGFTVHPHIVNQNQFRSTIQY